MYESFHVAIMMYIKYSYIVFTFIVFNICIIECVFNYFALYYTIIFIQP